MSLLTASLSDSPTPASCRGVKTTRTRPWHGSVSRLLPVQVAAPVRMNGPKTRTPISRSMRFVQAASASLRNKRTSESRLRAQRSGSCQRLTISPTVTATRNKG